MCVLPAELLPSCHRSFTPFFIRPLALASREIVLSRLSYKLSSVLVIPGVHRSMDLVPYGQPNAHSKQNSTNKSVPGSVQSNQFSEVPDGKRQKSEEERPHFSRNILQSHAREL
jgi:hypothetical protein